MVDFSDSVIVALKEKERSRAMMIRE